MIVLDWYRVLRYEKLGRYTPLAEVEATSAQDAKEAVSEALHEPLPNLLAHKMSEAAVAKSTARRAREAAAEERRKQRYEDASRRAEVARVRLVELEARRLRAEAKLRKAQP